MKYVKDVTGLQGQAGVGVLTFAMMSQSPIIIKLGLTKISNGTDEFSSKSQSCPRTEVSLPAVGRWVRSCPRIPLLP